MNQDVFAVCCSTSLRLRKGSVLKRTRFSLESRHVEISAEGRKLWGQMAHVHLKTKRFCGWCSYFEPENAFTGILKRVIPKKSPVRWTRVTVIPRLYYLSALISVRKWPLVFFRAFRVERADTALRSCCSSLHMRLLARAPPTPHLTQVQYWRLRVHIQILMLLWLLG